MRTPVLAMILAGFVGTAAAGELDPAADARYYDSNDYSAKLFYRVDFGGTQRHAQSMGLRFDNELAASRGAPALFQAKLAEQGLASVTLQGLDLRGPDVSAGQTSGGGYFSNLTAAQWVGIALTGLVFGAIVVEASDDDAPTVSGTGGTGGG